MSDMSEKTVRIPDISCGHCVKTIERELGDVEGVTSVAASQSAREVRVRWDDARTSWEAIRDVLEDIHYPPAE